MRTPKAYDPGILELQAASLAIPTPRVDTRIMDTLHTAATRAAVKVAARLSRHIEAAPLGLAIRHNAKSAR